MEETKRVVLRKHRMHISRTMNPRKVVEVLYSRDLLDADDREVILAETTTQRKALKLLDIGGCKLQVAGCRCRLQVQVAGCRLQVAGCRLRVVGNGLQVAGCRLITK